MKMILKKNKIKTFLSQMVEIRFIKKILEIFIIVLLTSNVGFADSLRVVDGDIIVLNGEKIRFFGI